MPTFVVYYDWELEQLGVKIAFLHCDLDEKIFMNLHKDFKSIFNLIDIFIKEIFLWTKKVTTIVV